MARRRRLASPPLAGWLVARVDPPAAPTSALPAAEPGRPDGGGTVILLPPRRRAGKAPVVFRQILCLQVRVGLGVAGDLFAPQLLHQPVLMRAVNPLHASLGLRRAGRDQLDP